MWVVVNLWILLEARSPKSEIRRKPEVRNPNGERTIGPPGNSDLGFRNSYGLRLSVSGFLIMGSRS